MKALVQDDLMNILEYEKVRDEYRKGMIEYKRHRRITLGPYITITFENRKTMKFQIQEMMRTERMVQDHQIQSELDIYNSLLPQQNGLSATLFIEIKDAIQIRPILNQFIGLTVGKTVLIRNGDLKISAQFEEGREEGDKISAVHYIQFHFDEKDKIAFLDGDQPVELIIDYNEYKYITTLPREMIDTLTADLIMV
jgi:hypothetical protein